MLNKKNVPPASEVEFHFERDGSLIHVVAVHKSKRYKERIPLHDYHELQEGNSYVTEHYVKRLMARIAVGKFKGEASDGILDKADLDIKIQDRFLDDDQKQADEKAKA